MATYTNVSQFRASFFPKNDDEAFESIVQRSAVVAHDIINVYLSGLYAVPFSTGTSTPPMIRNASDFLTKGVVLMLQAEPEVVELDVEKGEGMPVDVKFSMMMIEKIARGKWAILDTAGDLIARLTARAAFHSMQGVQHIFDLDSSTRHLPDRDYLDDLATDRDNNTA